MLPRCMPPRHGMWTEEYVRRLMSAGSAATVRCFAASAPVAKSQATTLLLPHWQLISRCTVPDAPLLKPKTHRVALYVNRMIVYKKRHSPNLSVNTSMMYCMFHLLLGQVSFVLLKCFAGKVHALCNKSTAYHCLASLTEVAFPIEDTGGIAAACRL